MFVQDQLQWRLQAGETRLPGQGYQAGLHLQAGETGVSRTNDAEAILPETASEVRGWCCLEVK